jgi:hypothetical protein
MEVTDRKTLAIIFLIGYCLTTNSLPSLAQNPSRNLILIYTNNIWAEIDPCPV